jgi:hypothetical protein
MLLFCDGSLEFWFWVIVSESLLVISEIIREKRKCRKRT